MQQSNPSGNPSGQLFVPQRRSPAQSVWWSQSPSFSLHLLSVVQQSQAVFLAVHLGSKREYVNVYLGTIEAETV